MRRRLAGVFSGILLCAGLAAQEGGQAEPPDVPPEITLESLPTVQRAAISRNRFLVESMLMASNSRLAIIEGDYAASLEYSAEALRLAKLSDDYIASRLRRILAGQRVAEAGDRILWAESSGAAAYFPAEVDKAKALRAEAQAAIETSARIGNTAEAITGEEARAAVEEAIRLAGEAIAALSGVAAPPPQAAPQAGESAKPLTRADFPDQPSLPAQYTVRPWDVFGDCFWNISTWFYDTPWRWTAIYEANRDKIPEPDNPNLIEVGTVLDIPDVEGEARRGMWDSGRPYPAP